MHEQNRHDKLQTLAEAARHDNDRVWSSISNNQYSIPPDPAPGRSRAFQKTEEDRYQRSEVTWRDPIFGSAVWQAGDLPASYDFSEKYNSGAKMASSYRTIKADIGQILN